VLKYHLPTIALQWCCIDLYELNAGIMHVKGGISLYYYKKRNYNVILQNDHHHNGLKGIMLLQSNVRGTHMKGALKDTICNICMKG